MAFGQLTKEHRIRAKLTLRDFCQKAGLDPSNWSKVERGVNPPPRDARTLERIAKVLNLTDAGRTDYLDMAAIERREFPEDVASNVDLMKALPAFFRSARDHALTDEELKAFGEDIRRLNTRDPDA
jgi:transcriptional regulator with XRE-family HTH domain